MESRTGHLAKMKSAFGEPVEYRLPLDDAHVPLNPLIGKEIAIEFAGVIHCTACGRKIKKTYSQGYCFPCVRSLAACDMCIVRPEQCHYHLGTCREPEWGERHCMQPHVVYLANSSGVKVGITRAENIPHRWIDQGAVQALPIMRVQSRYQSGLLEVALKDHVADKTDWRKMLRGDPGSVDLLAERDRLLEVTAGRIAELRAQFGEGAIEALPDESPMAFTYPVQEHPVKVRALNLDKTPRIEGALLGVKAQYLILSSGVLNVRKFTGYEVTVAAA